MKLPYTLSKKLILKQVPLLLALDKLDTGNSYIPGQPCFCPFHDNTNTPAASIYQNESHDSLWCFAEQRLYTSVDVLEKLLHRDIYYLAEQIWANMEEAEQAQFLSEHKDEDLEQVFSAKLDTESDVEFKRDLGRITALYQASKLSYSEYITKLRDLIKEKAKGD